MDPAPLFACGDEPGVAEQFEVLGDGGGGQTDGGGDVADTGLALSQNPQDAQPTRVREGREEFGGFR